MKDGNLSFLIWMAWLRWTGEGRLRRGKSISAALPYRMQRLIRIERIKNYAFDTPKAVLQLQTVKAFSTV